MSNHTVAELEAMLDQSALTSRDLHSLWERRQPVPDSKKGKSITPAAGSSDLLPWLQSGLATAVKFCERALAKEEFLLVCDCAVETLRFWPEKTSAAKVSLGHVRLRQHYADALARLGYGLEARKQLERYVDGRTRIARAPELKASILLQLGNILREEAACAPMPAARDEIAGQALGFYRRALEAVPAMPDALTLAAAVGFLIGRPGSTTRKQAQRHARQLLALTARRTRLSPSRYDLTEHRAVALAVLNRPDEAWRAFHELARLPDATTTRLADTRYWAQTLAEGLELPNDHFRPAFPSLPLVVFSGHLPDHPDRAKHLSPRFPPGATNAVRRRLRATLHKLDARVGMVSAAAGADLLFIDELHARGGKAHLILPWSEAEFRETSVTPYDAPGGEGKWQRLFEQAVANAASVRTIGEAYQPASDAGLEYTMEVTAGLALHAARTLRLDICPLVLWDEKPGEVAGGTASFVKFWQHQLHCKTEVIRLPRPSGAAARIEPDAAAPRQTSATISRSERETFRHEVKTLLFADIVGYSRLREAAIPRFVGLFLDGISRLAATSRHAPRHLNTWGDAIYGVFDFAHHAGCFAMELIQLIGDHQAEWMQQGLCWSEPAGGAEGNKRPLNIRVGLHTGPVFMHYNPVVRNLGFTGVHVSKAARIEPVAQPGEVYASEEFTALAELDRAIRRWRPGLDGEVRTGLSFLCEYAGSMSLAKDYPGRHRLYRVTPHRVFALEALAHAIHAEYCEAEAKKGSTVADNPSMSPWDELPESLRDSNRAQAADLPHKLEKLGYELSPSFGVHASAIEISEEQATQLSKMEHARWMREKRRGGWKFGHVPLPDPERKLHPSLVPWEQLPEAARLKDLAAVQNVPKLIEIAGFRIRKIVRVP